MADYKQYLTYDEYTAIGGEVSESAYPKYERKAHRLIDKHTFNRLHDMEVIEEEVKDAIALMIDVLFKDDSGEKVTSFSNGKNSFSFTYEKTTDQLINDIVSCLPISLISGVVECE